MFTDDAAIFVCIKCKHDLTVKSTKEYDGEVVEGELQCSGCGEAYRITNGIPRFTSPDYNKTWDFKWQELDGGKAYNYEIIEDGSIAYEQHDIFDRNNHDGHAWDYATNRLVLDIGCGIGQYSVKLMREYSPRKIVAFDLTGGVDIFRKTLLERFPQFKNRIIIAQASVFDMPFRDNAFDYIFSLGVLHHTGDTKKAIRAAASKLKDLGQLNFWVYSNMSVSCENKGRDQKRELAEVKQYIRLQGIIEFFRRIRHDVALRIVKLASSELWHKLSLSPYLYRITRIMPPVNHPDYGYRLINMYDGYCNSYAETWDEYELFPLLRELDLVVVGVSAWRVGFWCRKDTCFFKKFI